MKVQSVIHEVLRGEHRIILFLEDGTTSDGSWTPISEVTKHKGYYAVTGESPLPQGVFTCKEVPHRMLG